MPAFSRIKGSPSLLTELIPLLALLRLILLALLIHLARLAGEVGHPDDLGIAAQVGGNIPQGSLFAGGIGEQIECLIIGLLPHCQKETFWV